ncbi:MAG: SH3 domain-containing protein [Chloroflexi bacterium]|nr:SH3 domain-containing protein [Chloroflexota bacterium]
MNRFIIGINIVLVMLLAGCASGLGKEPEPTAELTPTSHPFFIEETPTVTPTPRATLSGPSAELLEMANATLTAAAPTATETSDPSDSTASTPSPVSSDESLPVTPTVTLTAPPEVQPIYRAVYLRSGPGTNYDILRFLHEGETVLVVAKDGEEGFWYNVELENGDRGWVAMSVSEPVFAGAVNDLPVAATIPPPPTSTPGPSPTPTETN